MDGEGNSDEGSAADQVRHKPSSELVAQEKAIRRAKKRAREEQEASRLIQAGSGMSKSAFISLKRAKDSQRDRVAFCKDEKPG